MEILKVVIGSIITSAVIVFLLKTWVSTRIQKSIQNEYDRLLEKFKQQMDNEKYKFCHFYDKELDVITQFYLLLNELDKIVVDISRKYVHQDVNSKDLICRKEWHQEHNEISKLMTCFFEKNNEAMAFIDANRIFFPEENFKKSYNALSKLHDIVHTMCNNQNEDLEVKIDIFQNCINKEWQEEKASWVQYVRKTYSDDKNVN